MVGNNLEVIETIKALNGNMEKDVEETVIALASLILTLTNGEKDLSTNGAKVMSVINSGQALTKFKQMVIAQRWRCRIYQ